jgi:hypothetical protein
MPPTRARPIRNPRTAAGVTREAAVAAGIPEGPTVLENTVSDDSQYGPIVDEELYVIPESFAPTDGITNPDAFDVGAAIDDAMDVADPVAEHKPKVAVAAKPKAEKRESLIDPEKPQRDATKSGPPTGQEWQDFFSRIVLKVAMEYYVDFVFRGVDENLITDADLERLRVRKEERDTIARPFAEYANKNTWTRKHGREILAAADSMESLVILGIWISRVNRIAKRYKPRKPQKGKATVINNGRERQASADGPPRENGNHVNGATGGHVPGFQIFNPGGG